MGSLSLCSGATVELFFSSISVFFMVLCFAFVSSKHAVNVLPRTCHVTYCKSTSAVEQYIYSLFHLLYFSVFSRCRGLEAANSQGRTRLGTTTGRPSRLERWLPVSGLRLLMKQPNRPRRRKEKARCCGYFLWYHAMRLLLLHVIQRQP
jgi:hypothetical protein